MMINIATIIDEYNDENEEREARVLTKRSKNRSYYVRHGAFVIQISAIKLR